MIFPQKITFTLFLSLFLTLPTFTWQLIPTAKSSDKSTLAQTKAIPRNIQLPQVLTLYQPLQNLQWEGERISNTGIAYFPLDGFSNESISKSDLDEARASKEPRKIAKSLAALGLSYHLQREYDRAIGYYKEALEIVKQNHDSELEAMLLGNLGLAHVEEGDYSADTIDYLNNYWTLIYSSTKNNNIAQFQAAKTLGNLGNAYYGADLYVQAIAFHQKRLVLSRKIQDRAGVAKALSDLGIVYQALGDYKKSIDYYEQSLTLTRQIKEHYLESFALGNLGVIYQTQGDYFKARNYQQQRLVIAREIKDLPSETQALANLGGVAYFQGDYNKAIALYEEAWKITWDKLHDADILYRIRGNQGLAYFQMGNNKKALEAYQQYFQYASSRSNRREEGIAKINAAAVRQGEGNLTGAAKTLREAMEIWESLRARLGNNDSFKISIFETQNAPYSNLQSVLVDQNQPEAALEISERGRARAYAEQLARSLSLFRSKKEASPLPLASPTIAEIKKVAQNHRATLVEYSIVPGNFKVQGKLETHESELLIWVVQPTGNVTLRRVDLKPLWQCQNPQLCYPKGLTDLVIKSRDLLIQRNPNLGASNNESSQTESNPLLKLQQLLIQPVADLLPKDVNAHVVFIPHRSLFLIPFSALQDTTGKFLIERYTISIAPSIQVLDLTDQLRKRQKKGSRDALIVGNPIMPYVSLKIGEAPQQLPSLPGAEKEADAIAELLKTQALIGKDATKNRVLQRLPTAGVAHFATHGILDEVQGLNSAIALAPNLSQGSDGLLTSQEILDLKLDAKLVVLSACDTGRGRITGDGVIGLSRSLISAGTPSIIVSLWAIDDDSTKFLMTEFYQNLQQGIDKATALRKAMLATKLQYGHPSDWAAFTLIGEAQE